MEKRYLSWILDIVITYALSLFSQPLYKKNLKLYLKENLQKIIIKLALQA